MTEFEYISCDCIGSPVTQRLKIRISTVTNFQRIKFDVGHEQREI